MPSRAADQDRIRTHARRALEELDRARAAESHEAAIAHLGLSELHLAEMHALSEPPPAPARGRPRLALVRP